MTAVFSVHLYRLHVTHYEYTTTYIHIHMFIISDVIVVASRPMSTTSPHLCSHYYKLPFSCYPSDGILLGNIYQNHLAF